MRLLHAGLAATRQMQRAEEHAFLQAAAVSTVADGCVLNAIDFFCKRLSSSSLAFVGPVFPGAFFLVLRHAWAVALGDHKHCAL
jgi:hypothetical protein